MFQPLSFHNLLYLGLSEAYDEVNTCTRGSKLRGVQRSPEPAFMSTDFRVPENLIILALLRCIYTPSIIYEEDVLQVFACNRKLT